MQTIQTNAQYDYKPRVVTETETSEMLNGEDENSVRGLPVFNKKDEFPLDAVPDGWLKDYITFAKPLTEASEIFHFATGLAILSSVIGRKVYMDFGANMLYPNFYILLVGDSGVSRKSSAIGLGSKFLREVNPDILSYDTFSLEAFLQGCQVCPQKFLFFDEFRSLIELENKSYGKGIITLLTRAWSCPDRISTGFKNIPIEDRVIQEPYFTLLSATTLDWLTMNREDITGGFLGRFIPILSSGSENVIPIPPCLPQAEFNSLVGQLKKLAQKKGAVTFTKKAEGLYEGQYREHKRELKQRDDSDLLQPFYSRIDVNIIKLATTFQMVMDGQLVLSLEAVQRATRCMEHIKLCYVDLVENQIVFCPQMKLEKRILDIVKDNEGIKHRKLTPRLNCPAQLSNPAIESLLEKDQIRRVGGESHKEAFQYYLTKR